MNVLMLGWEYPPHIAGGLGVACEGLTQGLARLGVNVTFVVPQLFGEEVAPHMTLMDSTPTRVLSASPKQEGESEEGLPGIASETASVSRIGIEAFLMPYWTEGQHQTMLARSIRGRRPGLRGVSGGLVEIEDKPFSDWKEMPYGGDIFEEVSHFAYNALRRGGNTSCDVVHAHDWMTYPAGAALAHYLGKPLVVHVHSLEHDRSGQNVNPRIYEIERQGLRAADAIIGVSHYTKQVIHREYGIPLDRIFAVHNGIYPSQAVQYYRSKRTNGSTKIVLFLGRVTFQKGPEYFIKAAAKVIPHIPGVLFVMAGAGDMLSGMVELARDMDVADHFQFPGFLKGREVEQIFSVADLYVMPSVSEPFGLSALEAVNFNVPALISKQSGVCEVVNNSLKFDFWDVDRLADLIINGLLHDELRQDMITMAHKELSGLRWDASAEKTLDVYRAVAQQKG